MIYRCHYAKFIKLITADATPKNMVNNQKGFANIVLIITLVVILAGAAGYSILVKKSPEVVQQTHTPTPTPQKQSKASSPAPVPSGEMANWKKFRNSKYGIEFRYPPEWKMEQKNESTEWDLMPYSEVVISPDFRELDQTDAEESYDPAPVEKGGRLRVALIAVSHRTSMSWEQYVKEQGYGRTIREINNLK